LAGRDHRGRTHADIGSSDKIGRQVKARHVRALPRRIKLQIVGIAVCNYLQDIAGNYLGGACARIGYAREIDFFGGQETADDDRWNRRVVDPQNTAGAPLKLYGSADRGPAGEFDCPGCSDNGGAGKGGSWVHDHRSIGNGKRTAAGQTLRQHCTGAGDDQSAVVDDRALQRAARLHIDGPATVDRDPAVSAEKNLAAAVDDGADCRPGTNDKLRSAIDDCRTRRPAGENRLGTAADKGA
jgi:hypothetical protein